MEYSHLTEKERLLTLELQISSLLRNFEELKQTPMELNNLENKISIIQENLKIINKNIEEIVDEFVKNRESKIVLKNKTIMVLVFIISILLSFISKDFRDLFKDYSSILLEHIIIIP